MERYLYYNRLLTPGTPSCDHWYRSQSRTPTPRPRGSRPPTPCSRLIPGLHFPYVLGPSLVFSGPGPFLRDCTNIQPTRFVQIYGALSFHFCVRTLCLLPFLGPSTHPCSTSGLHLTKLDVSIITTVRDTRCDPIRGMFVIE